MPTGIYRNGLDNHVRTRAGVRFRCVGSLYVTSDHVLPQKPIHCDYGAKKKNLSLSLADPGMGLLYASVRTSSSSLAADKYTF